MPPPVEAGAAPMNMRADSRAQVVSRRPPMSTVLKPAVRGVTPWNRPTRSFVAVARPPSDAGLVHSNRHTSAQAAPTRGAP